MESKLVDDVGDLCDVTGRFGKFQKRVLFVSMVRSLCVALTMYSYYFVHRFVPFTCDDEKDAFGDYHYRNSSANATCYRLSYSVETSSAGQETIAEQSVACQRFKYEVEESVSTIVEEWDLVCSRKWMISFGYMVFSLGTLMSYLPVGQLSDKFGRRPVALICQVIMIIASFVAPFSTSMPMFLVLRFFAGSMYAVIQNNVLSIYIESVGPEFRNYVVYALNAWWGLGTMLISLIAWVVQDWRTLMFVSSLPIHITYLLLFFWLVPESTRWLLSTKRYERAQEQVVKQAEMNGKMISDIDHVIEKLKEKIELDSKAENASFVDILRNKYLRRTAVVIYFTLCTTLFIYYGLPMTLSLEGGSIYLKFFLFGLVDLVSLFVYLLMMKIMQRKKALLSCLVVQGIVFLAVIPLGNDFFWLKLTLFMIGKTAGKVAFSVTYVYAYEIFPTNLRAVGVGGGMACGRIGVFLAPLMDYLGRYQGNQVPLIVYGVVSFLTIFVYFLLPNTEDKHLPDTVEEINMISKKRSNGVQYEENLA